MADSETFSVDTLHDVEDLFIRFYIANGHGARAEFDTDRRAGDVRVTRTGGDLESARTQDVAYLLTEVWDGDAVSSWSLAEQLRCLVEAMGQAGSLGGVQVDSVETETPRTLDDEYAPELHRHQFLTTIRIETYSRQIEVRGL